MYILNLSEMYKILNINRWEIKQNKCNNYKNIKKN